MKQPIHTDSKFHTSQDSGDKTIPSLSTFAYSIYARDKKSLICETDSYDYAQEVIDGNFGAIIVYGPSALASERNKRGCNNAKLPCYYNGKPASLKVVDAKFAKSQNGSIVAAVWKDITSTRHTANLIGSGKTADKGVRI